MASNGSNVNVQKGQEDRQQEESRGLDRLRQ